MNDFPRDFPFIFVFGERLSHTKQQKRRARATNVVVVATGTNAFIMKVCVTCSGAA